MSERFDFDEYESPHCRMPHLVWEWGEWTERIHTTEPCGEEVWLVVEHCVSVGRNGVVDPQEAGSVAITSRWKVVCARGHVHAISNGEESAEEFDWDLVFPTDTEALAADV